MYRRVAQRLTLRTAIALTISLGLLPTPGLSLLIAGEAQGPNQGDERKGRPRPGKPEGEWPNLDEPSPLEPEAPLPIHSTIRSSRNSGKPWDGRRVGDPPNGTERGSAGSDLASNNKRKLELRSQTRRAHARARMTSPPPPHDQFVSNFFLYALARSPSSEETTYWYDQLRVAYANGATSLRLAGIELGRTLFESAEYVARNRDAHWYVYDLYKTYLMRDPDAGGWAMWEGLVPTHGREYVRRGFEESGEFATLAANITTTGAPSSNAASLISARLDPRNQPGNGMLSRDTNWSVPLLSLPGRAGLDLGISLSYSSMVWTRSGPYIYFDEDNASLSPGFRIGFPAVQRKAFDTQTAKNAYLLITPAGRRVELRQVGTSNIYDAADSSYLRLTEEGALLRVHSTDGTRLTYSEVNGEYRCKEVKDRNGNYLTVNHNGYGQITNITDTLGRVITFNYDSNSNLSSITQVWGAQTHTWATFGWTAHTMQSNFGTLRVVGTANNTLLPLLKQVGLPDGDRFEFEYTNAAQVSVIKRIRTGSTLPYFYTVYQYESTTTDVPRLNQTRVAAENWTSLNGVPGEVTTSFGVDPDGACSMTAPDGTLYKEYYGTGWQKGLTTLSEVWSGGVKQKWITTAWTQDNTGVSYEVNPRVTETNVYDAGGNRRRTTINYGPYAQWGLPYSVKEYAADAVTPIRETLTDYNLSQAYVDRRIIGLVSAIHQTNISSWQRKTGFTYDDPARLHSLPAAATQHDATYNTSFTARGNLTAVSRWDVNDIVNPAKALTAYSNYFTTGTPKSTTDAAGHQNSVVYTDSFSDSVNRNTFAYPTTMTDADGFSSSVQYNFNFGGTTRTQGPPPAGQTQGAIQTITYDSIGRLARTTTENNGAYTRYEYGPNFVKSFSTVNNVADEAYTMQVVDGVGRVIGTASNHPGSTGGYSAQMTIYDLMGRATKTSNPAEVNVAWTPTGDDAAGWLYTQQTYDWQGRPLRTTHPDNTYKEASYSGCGCAGGAVATLTDEGTIDAGLAKRRQQKIYSDVLGRTVKTEILNWQNGSVYSATVNTYNARDQVTQVRQYAGPESSGTYQDTTMTYDGYGRLKTKHVPEQNVGSNTVWNYNGDDTIQSITDARGAAATYAYNNRHLVMGITYSVPPGSQIPVPAATSYSYDSASNRTAMTDALGTVSYEYDQLSRLKSETRGFTGVGNYKIDYQYNFANDLKSITDPLNSTINYTRDNAGRLTAIARTGQTFASGIAYRASGSMKYMLYGDNSSMNVTFNSRMRPATFTIPGRISKTYAYNNDGTLRFSSDLTDHRFDRSYSFDHVGRLKAALSGAEARGEGATNNRPYNQTYGYDPFSNLNQRTVRTWWEFGTMSASYANNRQQGYLYDADGRLLTANESYSYDAAGRNNFLSTGGYGTVAMSYDGDGRQIKTVEAHYDEEWNEITTPLYYLRSTVLGGQVLAEIDQSSSVTRRFVYAGPTKLAWIQGSGASESVSYEQRDPSGGTVRGIGQQELDPMGADAGTFPNAVPMTYEPFMSYGSSYNSANPNVTYSIDGIRVSVNDFMNLAGITLQQPLEGMVYFFRRYEDRHIKWLEIPDLYFLLPQDWKHFRLPTLQVQQNPTQKPMDTSQTEKMLTEDCLKFLNGILAQMKDPDSKNLLDILKAAKGRLFTRNLSEEQKKKALGGTQSRVGDPAFDIYLDEAAYANDPYLLIHELFHAAAGTGTGYNHFEMATAAYKVALADPAFMKYANRHGGLKEPKLPDYSADSKDPADWYNAAVFDNIARHGCTHPIDWNW
jgi:YD repeat-containing protein